MIDAGLRGCAAAAATVKATLGAPFFVVKDIAEEASPPPRLQSRRKLRRTPRAVAAQSVPPFDQETSLSVACGVSPLTVEALVEHALCGHILCSTEVGL